MNRTFLITSVVAMFVCVCSPGCGPDNVSCTSLTGVYVGQNTGGADTLLLSSDQSFERKYTPPGNATRLFAGEWHCDSTVEGIRIVLEPFPSHLPESDEMFVPSLPVEADTRSVYLFLDYDLNKFFLKKQSKNAN